jgi:hypothetical protein
MDKNINNINTNTNTNTELLDVGLIKKIERYRYRYPICIKNIKLLIIINSNNK